MRDRIIRYFLLEKKKIVLLTIFLHFLFVYTVIFFFCFLRYTEFLVFHVTKMIVIVDEFLLINYPKNKRLINCIHTCFNMFLRKQVTTKVRVWLFLRVPLRFASFIRISRMMKVEMLG